VYPFALLPGFGGQELIFNLAGLEVLFAAALPIVAIARSRTKPRDAARILIVDDDEHVRSMIGATLETQGYMVHKAASCREALEFLEQNTFDLVLTDIVIPDLGGIVLMERIREQHPRLPVIMVTANHDINVAVDSMRRGAYDYVLKPFERKSFLDTVHRAIEHRDTLKENHSYQHNLELAVEARTELLHQAMEDIERSYDITLEALGDALDLRDSETEGHSKRVTAYTIALARAMGIRPAEIKVFARAAFLHDIGKMAIPDEILRKPSALTSKEKAMMRDHCEYGYNMLRKIPFLMEAAEIVFAHQEHHNGGGYPSGLRGNEIPIGARIFAVADALDAITSDRPYRKARSFEAARKEIQRCSGTQFDPEVVEAFLRIPDEVWREVRSEITNQSNRFSAPNVEKAKASKKSKA
jgi:putative nucleotidyltransferase with HDIG domain